MSTLVSEKDSTVPATNGVKGGETHAGPFARLLAKVARWNGEYAHYQMEEGVWRKLAL